ncbi:flagellar hook-length control protein FliK [Pseudomonas sp. RP23018S]|uniref:flagellar hook-length control protein FliK n=1 Tax=Pseudomonas sp. RP23018S TaxID=3096037 RepID=UPI002ACA234D|nr:flagellar hook-length control protein FliK [Pseudomonas sp. RP23018S]MDZ5601577.1 flagellar hook-length control protein FliK [Pseudomonas sp. RP23018S]
MPVAPNPLLQAPRAAQSVSASAAVAEKPQQPGAGRFDNVLAGQARNKPAHADKHSAPAADPGNAPGPGASGIAAGGKTLPDTAQGAADDDIGTVRDANLVAGQVTDAAPGAQLLQAQAQVVAPLLQAAVTDPQSQAETFDPAADALAGMPTLRLALEQNAKAQGVTSAHAQATDADTADGPTTVNPLATQLAALEGEAEGGKPGEKSFGGLIDDGLKDLKSASSDTRVDDFANRLAELTQAATPKTANAVPVTPLQQPLPMNQGAWTEGLVNRVMYLSSQNLKSADIQLEPAELGRLNVRVNVAADQATQITFISGHIGVRDALDSQMHRLRELFTQQGLQQPEVNVADFSRQQQQQQQSPQDSSANGGSLSGVAARRAEAASAEPIADAGRVQHQQVVIGDSAVDYYA